MKGKPGYLTRRHFLKGSLTCIASPGLIFTALNTCAAAGSQIGNPLLSVVEGPEPFDITVRADVSVATMDNITTHQGRECPPRK